MSTMDDKTKAELRALLSTGKDCNKLNTYKEYYKKITGKNYGRGCSGCACNYLYNYLGILLKNSK